MDWARLWGWGKCRAASLLEGVALPPLPWLTGAHITASQEEWPGEDMSTEMELLWPGAALLLLLGAAAGLCVRCSRPGKGWGHRRDGRDSAPEMCSGPDLAVATRGLT